jgi:hypothetical protein
MKPMGGKTIIRKYSDEKLKKLWMSDIKRETLRSYFITSVIQMDFPKTTAQNNRNCSDPKGFSR